MSVKAKQVRTRSDDITEPAPFPVRAKQLASRFSVAVWALSLSLLLLSCVSIPKPDSTSSVARQVQLPKACRSHCSTPYGELLGVATGTVPAYSNCSAECVVFDPNRLRGTFTGIKWQCVEFARRWLLEEKGAVFQDVDTAADIWTRVLSLTRVADGSRIPLENHLNGSLVPPRAGDLLIYAKEYFNTGHVAVITKVDLQAETVQLAEQNFLNQKWPGDHARQIELVRRDGRHWVLDAYVLGWKQMTSAP